MAQIITCDVCGERICDTADTQNASVGLLKFLPTGAPGKPLAPSGTAPVQWDLCAKCSPAIGQALADVATKRRQVGHGG